jgi:hypothetical protein
MINKNDLLIRVIFAKILQNFLNFIPSFLKQKLQPIANMNWRTYLFFKTMSYAQNRNSWNTRYSQLLRGI